MWPIARAGEQLRPGVAIERLLERVHRTTASRLGAGVPIGEAFDPDRWAEELRVDFLDRPRVARLIVEALATAIGDARDLIDLRDGLTRFWREAEEIAEAVSRSQPREPWLVVEVFAPSYATLYVYPAAADQWRSHLASRPWRNLAAWFHATSHATAVAATDHADVVAKALRPAMNPPAPAV